MGASTFEEKYLVLDVVRGTKSRRRLAWRREWRSRITDVCVGTFKIHLGETGHNIARLKQFPPKMYKHVITPLTLPRTKKNILIFFFFIINMISKGFFFPTLHIFCFVFLYKKDNTQACMRAKSTFKGNCLEPTQLLHRKRKGKKMHIPTD